MKITDYFAGAIIFAVLTTHAGAAGYRMKITVDRSLAADGDLRNFPVPVFLANPSLKPAARGGHAASETGADIFFVSADGRTVLPSEISSYDPESGAVKVWVNIPLLSAARDTDLFIRYGGPAAPKKSGVWDNGYVLVRHGKGGFESRPYDRVSGIAPEPADRLTVEAWVAGERAGGEALEPLVSRWTPVSKLTPAMFSAWDAGKTDGLDTRGYFGAVFDGRFVYFSPQRNGQQRDSVHGHVLRYDTHRAFRESASWEAYDAGNTGGLETKGYYGAVFEGRFLYFVPRGRNYGESTDGHTRILRYDTRTGFKNPSGWSAHDAGPVQSHQSAAFDGRFIYLCPGYEYDADKKLVESSTVIRVDTKGEFNDSTSYAAFDVKRVSPAAGCFDGASFDGRFVYFVPLNSGVVVRFDTTLDFGSPAGWAAFDAKPIGMKQNVGAVFDGRYLYFDAYSHGVIVRYDTQAPFADIKSWTSRDASAVSGLNTGGFDGGFFDGRYVWFAPFTGTDKAGKMIIHSNFLRYDTARSFDDPSSWDAIDASSTDGLLTGGYNAGAFDGRYFYLAPWRLPTGDYSQVSGNVLRVDTCADGGGVFSLRYSDYGHNGGLNAAVPGPSFLVNTLSGPASASAHRALAPGPHHLAGVYDGKTVRLFIDGLPAAEMPASGALTKSAADVEIGRIGNGAAFFRGAIGEARVSHVVRSDGWIRAGFRALSDPSGFLRIGKEEMVR